MITHHPSADYLAAFSAGTLSFSQAICVSAHIEHCSQCRTDVKRLNQVGSELLEHLQPAQVSESLKQSVMDAIDREVSSDRVQASRQAPQANALNSSTHRQVPKCLQRLVPDGFSKLGWKRLSPSIHAAKLCSDVNGSKVEMIKIQPGGQVASHNHTGEEITLVLTGSFSDNNGNYQAGDIIFRNKDDRHHKPIASQDSECICLTAVESPIQFTGFFARLFNPLIRRSHYAS
ncbi:MAG: ChrR family anti-sigma-E factor [Cellvibrionaceae bacterium]